MEKQKDKTDEIMFSYIYNLDNIHIGTQWETAQPL